MKNNPCAREVLAASIAQGNIMAALKEVCYKLFLENDWSVVFDVGNDMNKNSHKKEYKVKLDILNKKEWFRFAEKIDQMPECKNLTFEERLNIIMSYPVVMKTF